VLGAEKHNLIDWQDNAFKGWLDELRFSSRVRYTTTFTPPTAPFFTDSFTAALDHLDEGTGTIIFDAATGAADGTRMIGARKTARCMTWTRPFETRTRLPSGAISDE